MNPNPPPNASRPCPAPSNPLHRGARTRVWGAISTVISTGLVATLAALSVTVLGACGGGEAGDEGGAATAPAAPPARKAAVDFALESDYGPGEAPGPTTREQTAAAVPVAAAAPSATTATTTAAATAATDPVDHSAAPVDRQAHTWAGRYISRAVAERNHAETGGSVVWVDASCCAGLDPELPERIAFGMQAVLGEEAPLYVSGNDLRQAARLADRLDGLGVRRVYLVTP